MPVKNKNTSALFKEHAECESLTRVVRFTKHQTKQPLGSLTQSLFFVLPDDDEADFVKNNVHSTSDMNANFKFNLYKVNNTTGAYTVFTRRFVNSVLWKIWVIG